MISSMALLHGCRASCEEHVFTWPGRQNRNQNWNQNLPGSGSSWLVSLYRVVPRAGEESWRELGGGGRGYSD